MPTLLSHLITSFMSAMAIWAFQLHMDRHIFHISRNDSNSQLKLSLEAPAMVLNPVSQESDPSQSVLPYLLFCFYRLDQAPSDPFPRKYSFLEPAHAGWVLHLL